MSTDEALLFQELSQYFLFGNNLWFIFNDDVLLSKYGINYPKLMKLEDSPRKTDITVYDGEHPIGGSEYVYQEADSQYYERLAPVVSEYLDLLAQYGS